MTDPMTLFLNWLDEARQGAVVDPDVIALATSTRDGRPSVRMVLYRGIREGGFSFFTNYESRKGRELAENPFAAIVFYWPHLGKQVRVEGPVESLSPAESDRYFRQRPLESRITSVVSRQSRRMSDENEFLKQLAEAGRLVKLTGETDRPAEWGGFKLLPVLYEFWIHRDNRRHHRTLFEKRGEVWEESRLYP
jgi:pyridoxamine 5'-phosphate oxidase